MMEMTAELLDNIIKLLIVVSSVVVGLTVRLVVRALRFGFLLLCLCLRVIPLGVARSLQKINWYNMIGKVLNSILGGVWGAGAACGSRGSCWAASPLSVSSGVLLSGSRRYRVAK